jgi:hypothetical protein
MNEEQMNSGEEQAVDLAALGAYSQDAKLSKKVVESKLPRIPTIRVAEMEIGCPRVRIRGEPR